ncbi:MAG: glucosamine-6-phosphate deaminase [Luteitalea sp.]|nr:glucosamine-6-phosphate deaminase [Luteitalea sp.]
MPDPVERFTVDEATVLVYPTTAVMSQAAASRAAAILRDAIASRGSARLIVGTGSSQHAFFRALAERPNIDWDHIELFHMDEYAGMPVRHPASFRRWLDIHLAGVVRPRTVHYLAGDAADVTAECRRYASLLRSAPIDLSCIGFGENGHLAFNDPHVADFADPEAVKLVDLDERCRLQQVGEGHFAVLDAVPRTALTITCPALMSAEHVIGCVPERRKAEAVRDALEGPISPACPASLVRTHPKAVLYLDGDSAALLSRPPRAVAEAARFRP